MSQAPRLALVGAHPDDCDVKAGGIAALAGEADHEVRIRSTTTGDAGHHELSGVELADRRRREAEAAAAVVGAEFALSDTGDGRLEASLAERERLIRRLREFDPDLIVTHRPNDYHPDHRATAELVRDAAYLLTVPNVCPETPHVEEMPIVGYFQDEFTEPSPFEPDVVVDVGPVIDEKVAMLDCHESQMYEWLPYNTGTLDEVPDDPERRRAWLREGRLAFFDTLQTNVADDYRDALAERYGAERAAGIEHAEAIQISEYGAPLTEAAEERLFPF
jgi:LmbE family N-acetylglucosaminyl deacetylase